MSTLLLDTTVLIDALRGRGAADRIRQLATDRTALFTTAINVEEIVRGLRPREKSAADALFGAIRVLPIRRPEGELAGRWRGEFAKRGVTLHQADCLIAAASVTARARLATGNPKDFPMKELTVDVWPVG